MGGVLRFIVLGVLVVLATTSFARADVIGPEQAECRNRSAGDACDGGACELRKCSRARPGPDGQIVDNSYDCMTCVAGLTPSGGGGGGKLPIYVGIGIGAAALVAGIWFAKRKRAA